MVRIIHKLLDNFLYRILHVNPQQKVRIDKAGQKWKTRLPRSGGMSLGISSFDHNITGLEISKDKMPGISR